MSRITPTDTTRGTYCLHSATLSSVNMIDVNDNDDDDVGGSGSDVVDGMNDIVS